MNPLYNQPTGDNITPELQNGINNAKNLMNQLSKLQDPTQMLNDPMVKQALNLCRGSTPEQFARQLCARAGIDPNVLINALRK